MFVQYRSKVVRSRRCRSRQSQSSGPANGLDQEVRPGWASSVFALLVGGIRGDCREAPKGLHGLEADASKQFDPGDHQPGAPGDNVRSERQLLPSRELRDPLDQDFQVGLDRPKSVPARLWFAGIRDAFYSTGHSY